MPYRKTLTTIFLAAGGLALSGADARAQTPAPAGTYTLAQVNGQPLPVVTETEGDCRDEVVSGTLTLTAGGDWELEYLERETCGATVEEEGEGEDGDYTVDGATLRFSDDTDEFDANDFDLEELGVGTLTAQALTVTLQDGQTRLTLTR